MSLFNFKLRFFNRNSKLQLYVHVAWFEKKTMSEIDTLHTFTKKAIYPKNHIVSNKLFNIK